MKSTVDISTKLTRHSETGNISTSFAYVEGLPPMLVIKQKNGTGSTQVVEITMSEAHVFEYILCEINRIREMVERMDNTEKAKSYYGESIVGMLRGVAEG